MLQCNNYKGWKRNLPAIYHEHFFAEAESRDARYLCMASLAYAQDLRNMLSVAAKLRLLADETHVSDDQDLYREAADALESRAAWLAGALPQERHDGMPDLVAELHRPVNPVV